MPSSDPPSFGFVRSSRLAPLALALAGCGDPTAGADGRNAAADGAPIDAAPADAADATPPSSEWLLHATASSGFDHAHVALRAGGFWLAGDVGCAPGEIVHVGAEADPGRLALTCTGASTAFVARFTPMGQLAGAAFVETTDVVLIEASAPSDDGVIVVGRFRGTMRLSPGQPDEVELTDRGSLDVFVAAYAFDGALRWAAQIGGAADELATAVTRLADGTIAVAGRFAGDATFGSGAGAQVLTSVDLDDLFVAGFTPDGDLAFALAAAGPGNADARAVAPMSDGGFAIAGEFQRDLAIGGTTLHSAGENDMFVARFTAGRALQWARTAGAVDEFSFGESATALAVGPDDSLVVAGYLTGPTIFGAGEPAETTLGHGASIDMFLARYDLDGGLVWARAVEGADALDWIVPETLTVRGDELVVWGELAEHATFGPDEPGESSIASHGNFDVFLARYGLDGAFYSVRAGGGIDPDYAYGAVFGPEGGLLVGGLRATATLALWPTWTPTFTSTGLSDVFVAAVPDL